ncbi:MAG: hypothetical protein DRN78_05545 [Thermoproteota archaeon]|nr:MAG: hypothetical protein DRN78_05545 [Candidatus Korarchaeota archaeon]
MPKTTKTSQKPFFYKIKFSKKFHKLKPFDLNKPFKVLDVLIVNSLELSKEFLAYDTAYDGGYYPIRPKTDYLMLILEQDGKLLTTLRYRTPAKERFYRSLIGEKVGVKITRP